MARTKFNAQLRLPQTYDVASLMVILRDIRFAIDRFSDNYVHNTVSVSSSYSANVNDSVILCDTSGGGFTVTLPDAAETKDKRYTIKDLSFNGVTVTAVAGLVEGVSSKTTPAPGAAIEVVSDGENYWTLCCNPVVEAP